MCKSYCDKCNKKVNYNILKEKISFFKNVKVDIEVEIGICNLCDTRLYVDYLEELNEQKLFSSYRRIKGMIEPKEVIEFRERYNLTQLDLVSILDCGKLEITILEEDGCLQSDKLDAKLKEIMNCKNNFKDRLVECILNKKIDAQKGNRILSLL